MITDHVIDFVGWVGSGAVVSAYALLANNWLRSNSRTYQLLNLIGGLGLVINTIHYRAFPSTFVNIIWTIIAVSALAKAWVPSESNEDRHLPVTAVKKRV